MIIEVEKLCFGYGSHKVLNDISFNVGKGKLISIIGPNGVGKSTLFRCILGLIGEYSGIIRIEGNDIKAFCEEPGAFNGIYTSNPLSIL